MKMKYFLRGLGAGVLFATLIMLAAYMTSGGYKMSDDEVMKKAEKLGMVTTENLLDTSSDINTAQSGDNDSEEQSTPDDADEESHTSTDSDEKKASTSDANLTSEDIKTTEGTTQATTENIALTTTEITTTATTELTTSESTTAATTEITTESTTESTTVATTEATTTATTESTTAATTEDNGEIKTAVIAVTSGMSSTSAAYLLQEAGIISDYKDFDKYLDNNGYSTKIQVKSATYSSDMTYEEIAKLLISR